VTAQLDPAAWAEEVPVDADPFVPERERLPLIAEIARVRARLEAFRDGVAPATAPFESPADSGDTALARLVALFGLSPFERDVLMLAAAVELDGEVAGVAAAIVGGTDPRPTFGLALAALVGGHWDAITPVSPLRRWRLVELGPGPTLPSRPLRIDERVLHYLTGISMIDERLSGVAFVAGDPPRYASSQRRVATEVARTVAAANATLIRLDGDDIEARQDVAQAIAAELGLVPLVVRVVTLSPGPDLVDMARLIDREVVLLGALPIIEADADATTGVGGTLLDLLESANVVTTGGGGEHASGRLVVRRSVGLPSPAEQRALWGEYLGAPLPVDLEMAVDEISQHFRLGARAVAGVVGELASTWSEAPQVPETLRRLCRAQARVRLDGLAERIDPQAVWDDLVLPEGHLELLRDIVRHVRHRTQVYERWGFADRTSRGLGVTALFAGESGTGKTLAAEVLATELGLDLYRIDLSATVSKYIGETEKNLRRLFDAAEASGAVLLFDEADALFGKRGEVKDGHDRYANLEVAYLLQRMESYRGLAILTTNMRSHIDRAFLRRLRFVIQFPFPDRAQRADIWRRVFPPAAPLDGVDPDEFAMMTIPGGSIRSIAVSAAFAAAEDGTAVTADHVMHAARVEYAKAERSLTDAEAGGGR